MSRGATYDLIVFSHLRWNFVYQRPQHLLSRLAADRRVFFVEEPIQDQAEPWFEYESPDPNITVCRPHTPDVGPGFTADQIRHLLPLVELLRDNELSRDYVAWFYTPMALPLLEALTPLAVVYDCMDELSAFMGAPPELLAREQELLDRADVVFTGGPSLFLAKKNRHPNVHCFNSSIDVEHFGQARLGSETALEAWDQANLPRPLLGYFGVIDERLDLPLIDRLAEAHPEWQVVMVGPVVKIDPAILPQRKNVHYFGQKKYAELPSYLCGWDVCLMPFALNESTRHISPTKVLEYMAAERPIVSTPIRDVVEPYGHFVRIADDPEAFVAACEAALGSSIEDRKARAISMREVLAKTNWDATAAEMAEEIERAIECAGADAPPPVSTREDIDAPVVVIGAGPTGLSAAYHLGEDAVLLEQNDRVGGWCRSIVDRGFTFDFAGHIMFSNDPYVHELYEMLLGDNVHWQDREAWIYSKGVYTRYPFQGALYGLPPEVIKECLIGAIEARFGTITAPTAPTVSPNGNTSSNGHTTVTRGSHSLGAHSPSNGYADGKPDLVAAGTKAAATRLPNTNHDECQTDAINDCCADGVLESTAPLGRAAHGPVASERAPENFEEFIYRVWGAGIAKHFAIPYNKKLWAVDLRDMETSWLGGRVPMPEIGELIEGSLQPAAKPMGPNARFGYPLRGGFQALMDGFLPHLEGPVHLNSKVAAVSPTRKVVTLTDGRRFRYQELLSTMPLPVLIRLIGEEAPEAVQEAAAGLRYVSVRCVNLGVRRENLTDKHWIYYPEDTVFHRIFVQGNASPHCNPPGGFALTCEITYSEHKPLPCDGEDLIQRCIDDCRKVGFFADDDEVVVANQVDMPFAYVVYDHDRSTRVALIRRWLEERDIILAGRYSEWEYYNSDHAFLAGKKAAGVARDGLEQRRVTVR